MSAARSLLHVVGYVVFVFVLTFLINSLIKVTFLSIGIICMSAAVALFFVSAAEALAREVELIEWVSGWVTNVIFYT